MKRSGTQERVVTHFHITTHWIIVNNSSGNNLMEITPSAMLVEAGAYPSCQWVTGGDRPRQVLSQGEHREL